MKCEWNLLRPINSTQIWAAHTIPGVAQLDRYEARPMQRETGFQPKQGRALLNGLRQLMKTEVSQHCNGESGAYQLEEAVELLNVLTELEFGADSPPRFHAGPLKWISQDLLEPELPVFDVVV